MIIKSLYLHHFRVYEETFLEFSEGLNAFYGDNAQGKTTLLEAIYLAINGRTFRSLQTRDMIRYGESHLFLEILFEKNLVLQKIKILIGEKERKIYFNHTLCPSFASLIGLLQGVTILPSDLELIKGAPSARRQYLDLQIGQVDPLYIHHLMRYQKAMKQRNALLKTSQLQSIECWEKEMAISSAYITQKRKEVVEEIKAFASDYYKELFLKNIQIDLLLTNAYDHSTADTEFFLKLLGRYRKRDAILGVTTQGPHKDDLQILLDQKEAKLFASEGQQRSCAIALRFAEWERMNRVTEQKPLMLVDDIGLNLDDERRKQFYLLLQKLGQSFTTSTQKPLINLRPSDFLKSVALQQS